MFYLIYKITNTINGKIYVGKHQTNDINDSYLGSGIALKRSIRKHGKEFFRKEILEICSSLEEMNKREMEIVNSDFVLRDDTYNMCLGGEGGAIFAGRKHSESTKKILAEKAKGRIVSQHTRDKISEAGRNRIFSDETRQRISDAKRGKSGMSCEIKKKISDSLKAKHRGPMGDYLKRKISDSMIGKNKGKTSPHKGKSFDDRKGENHPSFKGWFITPLGKFATKQEASIANDCDTRTVTRRCLSNDRDKYTDWYFIPK